MINFLSLTLSTFMLFSPIKVFSNSTNNINSEYNWYYYVDKSTNTIYAPKETPFVDNHNVFYVGDQQEKVLYLTFDEGYENGYTNEILNILNKNQVPAAFFITKSYMKGNEDLVKRMANEGHLVCNHTVSHKSMPSLVGNKEKFTHEITDVEDAYKEITGKDIPKYFRPPMGKYSHKSLIETENLGYSTIFWSFAYKDWVVDSQPSKDFALKKITSKVYNGEILLLHACSKTNTEVLDEVIKKLKADGYEFKDLDYLKENANKKTFQNTNGMMPKSS